MPKSRLPFNPAEYALVADRITMFYARYPSGRIITELISRDRDVVFRASVYRDGTESEPAATGWASEREGDGDINLVACVENTETSAIGRALANLGFTASLKRPSREEMLKAERARQNLRIAEYRPAPATPPLEPRASATPPTAGAAVSAAYDARTEGILAAARDDVHMLLDSAEFRGFPQARLATLRVLLDDRALDLAAITRIENSVRKWLSRRQAELHQDPPTPPLRPGGGQP